jgi:hypothetical protein
MFVVKTILRVPQKRYCLRFDVSEQVYYKLVQASEESNMSIKDWVYLSILKELSKLDDKKKQEE